MKGKKSCPTHKSISNPAPASRTPVRLGPERGHGTEAVTQASMDASMGPQVPCNPVCNTAFYVLGTQQLGPATLPGRQGDFKCFFGNKTQAQATKDDRQWTGKGFRVGDLHPLPDTSSQCARAARGALTPGGHWEIPVQTTARQSELQLCLGRRTTNLIRTSTMASERKPQEQPPLLPEPKEAPSCIPTLRGSHGSDRELLFPLEEDMRGSRDRELKEKAA